MKAYKLSIIFLFAIFSAYGQNTKSFEWRSIGPAVTSGRVADLAINPNDRDNWIVATASGGVWTTKNHGLTFNPVFDGEGSYSIGCVSIDPNNSSIIWIGTGENNNQRSVAFGDGIYRSKDGGASWENMGLKESEHIGMIKVHPNNSNIIWVAAYGPLWNSGGERGIYKTTDGGKNWKRVLHISDHTGFNEVHLDPRNPDILYATSHQRQRKVWTYVSGGPESGLYKSLDGGENWIQLKNGIPGSDKGRFAIAISPVNPDVIYCMIEGHGFYKSLNRGASFNRESGHSTSGNYYVELFASPHDVNTIYSMDTYAQWSTDGGKSFKRLGEKGKHVDNHVAWIDPENPDHLILGCDGGLYETWDHASSWHFKSNLPITQFYRVATDNASPFYNVYGGTQDNFSLGGPSRTINDRGIVNSDWYVTQTGDGFESQVDPINPNIVYAQAQYGWLQRYDRLSGEGVPIKPIPNPDEKALRWNWDAPLLISPHDNKTLYFAANKVFKSTDRGNSWESISGDLTRKIDRNRLPLMDKVWSIDAIGKNGSTTIYGNIVALNESSLQKGLLYVGTDDGLIQISENDGKSWQKIEKFPFVPNKTYVNDIKSSLHQNNVVYAAFNNHKNGDFKPYVLMSKNKGKTWSNISGNLPDRGSVYSIAEDHINPLLLFAGTEFGIYFTTNGGEKWEKFGSGLPTVAVRDIEIQRRENDLVLATFGRGFYIMDDYSPLREFSDENLEKKVYAFKTKPGLVYNQASPIGYRPPGFLGAQYFMGDNPELGVTFTYNIKKSPKSLKSKRQEKEKDNLNIVYPSASEIRKEKHEVEPYILLIISDEKGIPIRRISRPYSNGIKRYTWDGRVSRKDNPKRGAHFAPEGEYFFQLISFSKGAFDTLSSNQKFSLNHLNNLSLPALDDELLKFQSLSNETLRIYDRLDMSLNETVELVERLEESLKISPEGNLNDLEALVQMEVKLREILNELNGDKDISEHEFEVLPGLGERLSMATWGSFGMRSKPTSTMHEQLRIVREALPKLQEKLEKIKASIEQIEEKNINSGTPYLRGVMDRYVK